MNKVLKENLTDLGWLNEQGGITSGGIHILAGLLEALPRIHEGLWGEAYIPLISRLVGVCVDLAVIRDSQCLLKWRDDKYFKGWECPGGSLGPGENWQTAVDRFAMSEFGIEAGFVQKIETFNNTENPRAHDITILLQCVPFSEPKEGQWFSKLPEEMIPVHTKYWLHIQKLL